jgi:hypothetical protein
MALRFMRPSGAKLRVFVGRGLWHLEGIAAK